jgi:tyrosine-protein kinase Etk/Wzc
MTNTEEFNSDFIINEEKSSVNIREILSNYVYHWPVFFLGVFVCIITAFIYLRYTQPIYSINSTLLIKDDKKGTMSSGGDLLNELNLLGSSKVVDNEIEILKSKTLMRKVVDRLNLSVSFKAEGRLKNSDLYSSKNVRIGVVQMNSEWFGKTLSLSFPRKDIYELEDRESGQKVIGNVNQVQRNIFGVYKIIQEVGLDFKENVPLSVTINDPAIITDQYLGQLNISLASKQSTVLTLSIQSAVPEKGQDILNTLIQVYNEASLTDKNKTTQSTIQFIDERLNLITGELTNVEKDVEVFKSSRGLTDLSNDANIFLENVQANDAKLSEVNLQISVIRDIERYVNSSSALEKLPSTLGINDPVLLAQITQLGELQLQRDRILATTTENNPVVEPITKQIETTRAGIKSSIKNIYAALKVSKAGLEGNNSQFQGSIKKVPGQERQLISIKRQQSIKESLYLYLLQKKEEAALSYAAAVADSRIVDPAYYSRVPIKPKGKLVYITSLLLGILIPVAYLYGKELLNDKLEGVSDLAKLTSTPKLGEILFNENPATIVVQENSRTAIAEQFRSIRTNMQFLHGKSILGEGKVTLITSGMSGEGKSFVASNLAAALALSGKRTILLELDLRKPKVSKYLNVDNNVGISNYLIGKAHIVDIVKATGITANFSMIGSGPIPPNPSELLVQNSVEDLFAYLRQHFDEIIVDSPPIGLVTDAQILSRVADATIYIVRQGFTLKEQVKGLDLLYKSKKFPKLNVILNGISLGGSYGYGYGYYSDDDKKSQRTFTRIFKEFKKRF